MSKRLGAPSRIWTVETSTAHSALEDSRFELDQEVVNDTLQRLKMPEDAGEIQIVGVLPGIKPASHREDEVTYHYLPVLPFHTGTTSEDFSDASLYQANANAARGLMNIVDHHRNELGMNYRDEERLLSRTDRKIGAAGLAGFTLFTSEAALASAGAEASGHGWTAVPAVLGSFAVFYYAFNRYRENVHIREKQMVEGAQKDRERMIGFIASGRPLVIPRADAQF